MTTDEFIKAYSDGPHVLRQTLAGMSDDDLKARPVPGRWSTLEVICHLADTESVYAERMKRVIAEEEPPLRGMDPDVWLPRLACHSRQADEEVRLIEVTRSQMDRILRSLTPADFQRKGLHSEDGPLTLEELLRRITSHMLHHVKFVTEKQAALSAGKNPGREQRG